MTRLLERKRFGDLSVADITTEAGVARSGFYFYFESKYAALGSASVDIWSEFVDATDSYVRPEGESVSDYVTRVLQNALRIWRSHEALLIASLEALPLDEDLTRAWREQIGRVSDLVAQQVERDRAAGLVAPGFGDVPALVRRLGETTMYLLYQDRSDKSDDAASEQTVEVLKHLWLSAMGART
ncbi:MULTISPECIES: TetR/AcrR family transcriptional regulator [unclassified Nocardioides]|uniref:TetR/AcrR family transcriptional regulator n=1 Tax=unclassified Nocardioides TaxID=2615069 RepID=UPI00138F4033|nr:MULTISPECIES: TetR/AcrR family transcriptional regulator [unclassified Nocardioides]